ncbi:hypothetical protein AJ79_08369 [Helicocarpus griseus UAMH5409]|uniref:WW domain-containing oxidoreductase n=1 Tax=Helicocarpus griseus UAMH5409 TaxID=1447875 RepID=A0A2B7WTL0_9EURO|nr:hypothetical protein AJ79_08369 [Helicocarpus griseus UAMH5409]
MSRYAAVHANSQGPGDSRPTALQIVKDEGMEGRLEGKVAVVTGVSSGLGIETVRALAATGATLYLTARNLDKAKSALSDIFQKEKMTLVQMDQESLESVRNAAKSILAKTSKVNILINNAGIMGVPELQRTVDGYEAQFVTNHLSHFLLFQLLNPALLGATSPEFQSRVVTVSSSAHRMGGINPSDNYNYEKGGYNPYGAYAQSKTANIYMANEIERRFGSDGLHATSVHPGGAMTGLSRYAPPGYVEGLMQKPEVMKVVKTPEQGAATTIWAAVGKEWEGRGGRYLSECAEAQAGAEDGSPETSDYTSHTYAPEKEARLWKDSLKLVGLPVDEK